MKTYLHTASFLIAIVLVTFACKDDPATTPAPNPNPGNPSLTISSVNPSTGSEGTKVIITGTGFSTTISSNVVKFGAIVATLDSASTTTIITKVPKDAKTGKVTVEVGGKMATSAVDFTVLVSATPVVNMIDPEIISPYGFRAKATFTSLGANPSQVTGYGFVWSGSNAAPTVDGSDTKKQQTVSNIPTKTPYEFDWDIKELQPSTNYYVRSFASYTVDGATKIAYSEIQSVKTLAQPVLSGTWKDIGNYSQASYSSFLTVGEKQYWVSASNTYEVEPLTAKLTKKADFPGQASGYIRLVAVGQKIYVLSGRDKSLDYTRETWEYDINKNTWKRSKDFPGALRTSPCVASVGNKVYYGLGSATTSAGDYYSDWWEYDPATDNWTRKKEQPEKTNGNSAFAVNGKLYLIANYDKTQSFASRLVYQYDPGADSWKRMNDAPAGELKTQGKTMALLNNKVYALQSATSYTQLWEYDAMTDIWMEKREFNQKVSLPFLFPHNNKVYLVGDIAGSRRLVEFTP